MNKNWVVGSSHLGALQKAYRKLNEDQKILKIIPLGPSRKGKESFHEFSCGKIEFSVDIFRKNFKKGAGEQQIEPGDSVGVSLGDPNVLIFFHANYWKTHEPAEICRDGCVPVPTSTIDALCSSVLAPTLQFLRDLKTLGAHPYWITFPAIKSRHIIFEDGVRKETAEYLDHSLVRNMTKFLENEGIPYVGRPEGTLTKQGFLKSEYARDISPSGQPDQIHANSRYGGLLLSEVFKILQSFSDSP